MTPSSFMTPRCAVYSSCVRPRGCLHIVGKVGIGVGYDDGDAVELLCQGDARREPRAARANRERHGGERGSEHTARAIYSSRSRIPCNLRRGEVLVDLRLEDVKLLVAHRFELLEERVLDDAGQMLHDDRVVRQEGEEGRVREPRCHLRERELRRVVRAEDLSST